MNIPLDKFEDYLRNKNLKERTVENYIYYFNKFTYNVFNQETISKFLSLKQHRNTIGRSFLLNLKKFLLTNYKELGISQDIRIEISEVELPKLTGRQEQKIIIPLQHSDIPLLESALEKEEDKLKLLLSYHCGLRLGELLKITVINFNWDKWKVQPETMGECKVYGKGDKQGLALVPSILMKRIAMYIRSNQRKLNYVNAPLFIKKPIEQADLKYIKNCGRQWEIKLAKAGVRAGITKTGADGKIIAETKVFPHKLRHSFASHLLNDKNLDIREIKDVLRHSSIQSTQIYTHIDKETLKERLST